MALTVLPFLLLRVLFQYIIPARHGLFDPEDLIVDDETLGEVDMLVRGTSVRY